MSDSLKISRIKAEDSAARETAHRLRKLRELAGLSQFDIARFLDCDRSTVSLIENGHYALDARQTNKLIAHLDTLARNRIRSAITNDTTAAMATA